MQLGWGEQPAAYGSKRGQKGTATPVKFEIHEQLRGYSPAAVVGGLMTLALPAISISESPGIHSRASEPAG
jgi:hypothetical protein